VILFRPRRSPRPRRRYLEKVVAIKGQPRKRQRATYAAAAEVEADLTKYLQAALRDLQRSPSTRDLVRMLQAPDLDEVYSYISQQGIEATTATMADALPGTLEAGALAASGELGGVGVIDLGRPAIKRWMAEHTAELITAIEDGARAAVNATIQDGVLRGRHPARLAKDVQQAIGLNERQAQAVIRRRAGLLAEGKSPEQVERIVERYSDKLLKQRAQTIAHEESMSAVNRGRKELWDQLAEDGALEGMEQQWLTGKDEMVCPYCRPLLERRVPLGGFWSSGPYSVDAPGLHIGCRCTTRLVRKRKSR